MVSRAIWKNIHSWVFQRLQIALVLRTRAILIVFDKLTRACFFQIALETILLPIQIKIRGVSTNYIQLVYYYFLWTVFPVQRLPNYEQIQRQKLRYLISFGLGCDSEVFPGFFKRLKTQSWIEPNKVRRKRAYGLQFVSVHKIKAVLSNSKTI